MDQAEIAAEHQILLEFFTEHFCPSDYWEGACESESKDVNMLMFDIMSDPFFNLALKRGFISDEWVKDLREHLLDVKS